MKQKIFRTAISQEVSENTLDHRDQILFLGSCFAENIGSKCREHFFNTGINPVGIYYDPVALSQLLQLAHESKPIKVEDVQQGDGFSFHWALHGAYRDHDSQILVARANDDINTLVAKIKTAQYVFVSLGSSIVFELLSNNTVVANCHKQPQRLFRRKQLSHTECVHAINAINDNVKELNRDAKLIFTVSPVRHIRHGIAENMLSKSRLVSAIQEYIDDQDNCSYFPSYEIMMDDLRDYRFYTSDMLHPNETAIDYIWDFFSECFFDSNTKTLNHQLASINKRRQHRAIDEKSKAHQQFLVKLELDIARIKSNYPHIEIT